MVIHEADLVDYAGMNLTGSYERILGVTLPAWADGVATTNATTRAPARRTGFRNLCM